MSTLDKEVRGMDRDAEYVETLKRERDEAVEQLRRQDRAISGFGTMIGAALLGGSLGGMPGAVFGGIAGFVIGINADHNTRK